MCLPSLLFRSELWIISQSQLTALERCQRWFLQKVFHLPKFTNGPVLMKLSGLRSLEAEIHYRKLLFFARILNSEPGDLVYRLFLIRAESFFTSSLNSTGLVKNISEILQKYTLINYFHTWSHEGHFPNYLNWKNIIKDRIDHFKTQEWQDYIDSHPYLILVHQNLSELTPSQFWGITSDHPDLVPKLNLQLRLMGNFGLQSSLPWLRAELQTAILQMAAMFLVFLRI